MLPSTALDVIYEKAQKLGKHKLWFLYLVLLFIVVTLINGVGIVPEEPYQRLSENPFITRTDIHFNNYWQETVLLPVVAHYLGLTGTITFNALTFVFIVGAYSSFSWLTFRRWGSTLALIVATLLITSPLTTVLLSWLGTPDGLTVLLSIPFIYTQSGVLIFFLALLGAANHPTFIIATLEILILRWVARDHINIKHIILAIIGVGSGYGSVKFFLYAFGIDVASRLDFMQLRNMGEWVKMNMNVLPITFFSLFNIQWLVLVVCLVMFYQKDKLFYSLILIVLLTNYGITFFTLDTTRVFSLLSWGVFFICIFHSYKLTISMRKEESHHNKQFLQSLIIIGMVSFIAPRFFSWGGEVHSTPFFEWIDRLLN